MGFETGNILEPSCGVGNFFGILPEEMRNSRLYGVELDSISGRIAQQLYPKATSLWPGLKPPTGGTSMTLLSAMYLSAVSGPRLSLR